MSASVRAARGRRRAVLSLALAGIAVLGIGAGITTAVWTDDVFFSATATSSSFDLQGSVDDGGTWADVGVPGDSDTAFIEFPATELDGVSPGDVVVLPFLIRNVGTVDGQVTSIDVQLFGGMFEGANPATAVVTGIPDGTTVAAGGLPTLTGNLTITIPVDWDSSYFDAIGLVSVIVSGQSS